MLRDLDVGFDAGHGGSPGGTGRLFPDVTLPTGNGGSLSLDSFRPRWDLVILMLGQGSRAAPAALLLTQLAAARAEIEAEDGQVLAVVAEAPSDWPEPWPYSFPLAFDVDASLHRRVAAVDDRGRPTVALYITDRYREIFSLLHPGDTRWPATARDVIEWLTFVNIQCPECNPPER